MKFLLNDKWLSHVSKILNGPVCLYFQYVLWDVVAYVSIYFCEIPEPLKAYLSLLFMPILLSNAPWVILSVIFKVGLPQYVAKLCQNIRHLHTFLTVSMVEATILWALTLLKTEISKTDKSAWLVIFLISVYYMVVTLFEGLGIKDKGSINGSVSVILISIMEPLGFGAVPIVAAISFGKSLMTAECCPVCRGRKNEVASPNEPSPLPLYEHWSRAV